MEVLVNAEELANDYISIEIEIPDALAITRTLISDLPAGWNSNLPNEATRDIGTNWAKGMSTAVLSVPSIVIPRELNYLLNPAHPDFAKIRFSEPEDFYFDPRLRR